MPLIVAAAFAGELPWACPTVTTPEEAEPYDDDAGVDALLDDVEAAARMWWDDGCAWTVTVAGDGTETQTCTTSAGADVTYEERAWYGSDASDEYLAWTLTVVPPEGSETWTSIVVEGDEHHAGTGSYTTAASTTIVTWTGAFPDAPDDGFAERTTEYDYLNGGYLDASAYETPGCAWSWDRQQDGSGFWSEETRTLAGTRYSVVYEYLVRCGESFAAYVDGVLYGAVTRDTWALDEVDLDGYSTAYGDCDDTDPTVHPCADEVPLDGVDQDCDGADLTDVDGDGHDAASVGGDDCDDTDAAVYPGANDTAGDGRDGDCDGADDVDADGDHYTADGDDRPADCDDTDATAFPGAREDGGDGIDQDCDGHDDVDADFDTWTADGDDRAADCDDTDPYTYPGATETPGDGIDQDCDGRDDPAPADTGTADSGSTADVDDDPVDDPEDDRRCGGADALLLVPLAGLRRRRKG